MSRVNPYVERLSARGESTNHQDPNTADGGLGAAGRGIASALARFGDQQRQVEDDQGRMWAANAAAENEVRQQKAQADRVNSLNPDAPDYLDQINRLPEQFDEDYQSSTSALMESAPNAAARKYLTTQTASGRVRTLRSGIETSANLNSNFAVSQVGQSVKINTDLIASSPDNDTFNDIDARHRATIMGLSSLDPATKLKLADSATHTYSIAQVQSTVARDPQGFLQTVNAVGGRTTNGTTRGQVPTIQNYNADTVKPYDAGRVQQIAGAVSAPSQYDSLFAQAGAQYGVDPQELKLRAVVESGLNPSASSGQANGIMQFAPETAKALGIDPNNPAQAIPAAAQLLASYKQKAGGDMSAVDKMYYGGENQAQWGPNTNQYAANLAAARAGLGGGQPLYVAPNAPTQGLLESGNIDLTRRPIVKNADGSVSTVRSMSFEEDGKEILVPTVSPDGKVLSDEQAIELYHKTGQKLGVFKSADDATAYAQALHNQQANLYVPAPLPQVEPLDEQAIAEAKPPIAGWSNLSWSEKVSAVRQAESQMGKSLADDRGAMQRELRDANASLLAGQPFPDINSPRFSEQNLVRLFGPDVGGRASRELSYNGVVGSFMAGAATMPAAQRAATLGRLAPVGGTDFAEREPTYRAAVEAANRVQAAQQKAPIDYAITNGIGKAQPLDFTSPDNLAASMKQREAVSNTMVTDYGTKPQIFTDKEVDTLLGGMTKMNGQDRIAYLTSVRDGLANPRSFATAMNELAPKNPTLAYAANLSARGGTSFVDGKPVDANRIAATIADGNIILNGRSLDKGLAKGDDPSMPSGSKAVNLKEDDFRRQFAAMTDGAFQSPDAQRSAGIQTEVYNAVKAYYVAESYQQGKPLDRIDDAGMKRAVDAVTGGVWDRGSGGKIFAPFGTAMSDFQNQWPQRVEQTLKENGFSDQAIKVGADQLKAVNLTDGKYGFLVGDGRMLVNPTTGRTVIVDYSRPYADNRPGFRGKAVSEPEQYSPTVNQAYNGVLQ